MPEQRPAHHTRNGFRNPAGSPERKAGRGAYFRFIWRMASKGRRLPEVPQGHALAPAEALAGVLAADGRDCITWLGHASFLIRLAGTTILLDPYLGEVAGPLASFGPKRFVPPGIAAGLLPPIDLLVVSHNHYDHLCRPTIEALPGKDRMQVAVPLRLGDFFRRRGYRRVRELDWHETMELDQIALTCLPAVHWSKRTLFDRNRSLWASFALAGGGQRIWFAGDTGYGPVFRDIGRDYGPFDLALIGIGAYEPRAIMAPHHTTPEEAVRLGQDLGAKVLVGMHWGTVILTDEHPFEPPGRFRAAAAAAGYGEDRAWLMRIGETRPLAAAWPANR